MKILSPRCSELSYAPTTPSKVAEDLDPELIGQRRSFPNSLLLKIGLEQGDGARIRDAVKAIRNIIDNTDAPATVVISAFAGLADPAHRLAPDTARILLAALVERLSAHQEVPPVTVMPFGWNKASWDAKVLDGEYHQRFTRVTRNRRAPATSAAHAVPSSAGADPRAVKGVDQP